MNKQAFDIIKLFEGCKLQAYKDVGGVPTIGYGHIDNVYMGQSITQEQADLLLQQDLLKYELVVTKLIKVKLNDNQIGALISFAFNLGLNNLTHSTLLKKVNNNEFNDAANEFLKWKTVKGLVIKGLENRRKAERELFLKNT